MTVGLIRLTGRLVLAGLSAAGLVALLSADTTETIRAVALSVTAIAGLSPLIVQAHRQRPPICHRRHAGMAAIGCRGAHPRDRKRFKLLLAIGGAMTLGSILVAPVFTVLGSLFLGLIAIPGAAVGVFDRPNQSPSA